MNSFRSLISLSTLLVVSLLFIGCQSETEPETPSDNGTGQSESSSESSATKALPTGTTIVKLDVGPAGISMEPLESVSSGEAETVFQSLSPDTTGIDFVNPIDQSHPRKYLFASAVACGGVAVGDVDNDGWSDIFFTRGPRKNRLYRQTSPMKFEDVTDAVKLDSGNAWSAGAAMVDIDNDGDLDIYVCNFDTPNHLFINNGDGTFPEQAKQFGVDYVGLADGSARFVDQSIDAANWLALGNRNGGEVVGDF